MIRFSSILSRIASLQVIAVVLTSILMLIALRVLLDIETKKLHDNAMRQQADAVAYDLTADADGKLSLELPPNLQDVFSDAYGRYVYAIVDAAGNVRFASSREARPVFPADPHRTQPEYLQVSRDGQMLSGASVPRNIGGQKVWVQVAEDLSHGDVLIDDIVGDFVRRVGWITVPILALLLAMDILIVRRALRPVLCASQRAQEITPARTSVRLPLDGIPDEIRPLVTAINHALDRLDHGFRLQRDFAADAAHELKTPLAVLRSRIETLDDRDSSKILCRDIEAMTRIINQLLDIAELETLVPDPDETADLHRICSEVAASLAPLALAAGKSVALSGADDAVWVRGNAEMLERAVRNVAENAINHTPAGTEIEIVVDPCGRVDVLDDGPGIAAAEHDLIFRRFWRRERGRSDGAGLGLSIVHRIVEAHAGTITIENRPTGGARFSVSLARAG